MQGTRPAVAALAVVLAACSLPDGDYFGEVDENPDPTHLRWCNSGEPEYIDTAMTTSTTGVPLIHIMFDGLAEYALDGSPKPTIAQDWEVSEDRRTFTFHLRDDAKWSNGRPLTAHDFRYHIARILQPETGSRNAEQLWRLKNGLNFNRGRVRLVTADSGDFEEGDIVEIIQEIDPLTQAVSELPDEVRSLFANMFGVGVADPGAAIANSNARTSSETLNLRDLGDDQADAYETIPPGAEVTLIELGGGDRDWAYVYYPMGGADLGIYGWVPVDKFDGEPNADVEFVVREIEPEHVPGENLERDPDFEPREGTLTGSELLMDPEVLGVKVLDDHTLVLETHRPSQHIENLMSSRIFRPTPREAVSRNPRRWTEPQNIVTSGPFHLTEWYERDRMEFEASPTFWDADNIRLERFTSYQIDQQAAAANYYRTGGCSAMTSNNMPSSFLPVLSGDKRGGDPYKDYTVAPYLGIYYMMFNVEEFDNVHLRRALNFATDRTEIPRMLHGGEIPTSQFNPGTPIEDLSAEERARCGVDEDHEGVALLIEEPVESCYVPPEGLGYDPERAQEELALAREQMGEDFPESFTIRYNQGAEGHQIIAQYLQHEWKKELGLDVSLQSQEWQTYLQSTADGNFEVGRLGWIGSFPGPSEMLRIFRCGAPNNRTRWCNDDFEHHYTEGLREPDYKKRLEHLREAEEVLLEDAPILPTHVYTQKHLQKPYVRDLAINLPDNVPHHRAWIDPDWAEREED